MTENIRFRPGHGLAVPLMTVAMLATAAGGALADPSFTYGNADDVKDVKTVVWTAAAEAGLVLTTGNSQTTTATAGIKTTRKSGNNQLAFDGGICVWNGSIPRPSRDPLPDVFAKSFD